MANSNNFDLKIAFSADLGNTAVVFRNVHSELTSSFGNLQGTVASSGNAIRSNMQQTGQTAKDNADAHKQSNDKIASSTNTMANQLKGGFNEIQTAFGKLGIAFATIGSIIGGGGWLLGMITQTQEAGKEVAQLSRMLNITLADASAYKEALEDLGLNTDTLVRASRLLTRQIGQDSSAFKQHGISLKDTNGEYKTTEQILTEVINKYNQLGNTIEANTFANRVFGRSYSEVQPMLRLTSEKLAEAKARAKEFNLILTTDQLTALRAYKKSQEDANDVLEEFGKTMTFYVMPIMQEFFKGMEANRDVLQAFAWIMREMLIGIISGGKLIAQIFYLLKGTILLTADSFIFLVEQFIYGWKLIGVAVIGNTKLIKEAQEQLGSSTDKFTKNYAKRTEDWYKQATDSAQGYIDMLKRIEESEKVLKGGGEEAKIPKSKSPLTPEDQIKEVMQRLAKEEAGIMAETTTNLMERNALLIKKYKDYQLELSVLNKQFGNLTIQSETELSNKITSIYEGLEKAGFARSEAIFKHKVDLSEQALDEEERVAERQKTLGDITQEQLTQKLEKILDKRIENYKKYYDVLRKLHGEDSDYLLRLKQEETTKLLQLEKRRTQLQETQNNLVRANSKKMANDIVNSFESGFKGMLAGTQSFSEGMRGIFNGLMNLVDEIIWSMVREWILGEEAKTAASAFGFETIATLSTIFHKLMSLLGWESVGEDVTKAGVKGQANIWAEWGAYPPIAIALTAGLLGVLAGLAFSARGGWDSVPFDGAMTELHKGEMVLPQHLAEKVRNMAEPQPSQNITYNIQALDAQSFKAFASKNKGILFNTHNSALRDGLQYGVRGV